MRKFLNSVAAVALGTVFSLPAYAQTAVPAGQIGNLIVNPWMELDILNEGAATTVTSTAAGTFTFGGGGSVAAFTAGIFDGWAMTDATSSSSNTVTMQNAALAPNGSVVDALVTIGTGSATHADGTLITFEQRIEPYKIAPLQYGTNNAQVSYLSFCAKASIAGTYGFYIAGGTAARTSDVTAGTSGSAYFHAFSIPTAAQFSCYQFVIPGDTGGTWLTTTNTVDATHGATLGFVLGINGVTSKTYGVPTATSADGVWQNLTNTGAAAQVIGNNSTYVAMDKTTGATFEITGVRWSLDGAPLGHDTANELFAAERYRYKTNAIGQSGIAGVAPRQNTSIINAMCNITSTVAAASLTNQWVFPVPMRAAPTIITFNPGNTNANWRDETGSADFTVVVDTGSNKGNASVNIGSGSISATVAHAVCIHAFADAHL